ncbi:unnamed protein product [Blepharisma stoltei]|uniref:LisH domain-containing protein ARMC9 n=1 Tax=Blepharisma stoltei TaxID=1481888 RepID=A0AAU9JAR5_9CILI|nr:unnamed protein product [Blepharisma stoltei]
MEDLHTQELIKEYLTYHGFSSTLECFNAELKSKAISKQTKKPTTSKEIGEMPRLYTISLGEDGKAARVSTLEKRLENAEKSKENILRNGRKLFEIVVDTIQLLEEQNSQAYQDKISVYKKQLAKIQEILGLRVYETESISILNPNYIQEMKTKILNDLERKNYTELAELLVTLRAESLSAPKDKRSELIRLLSSEDIFSGSLRNLLTIRNHSIKSCLLALVSILCSENHGRNYILSGYSSTVIAQLMAEVKEQESGSVTQRFALAALSKLSYTEDEVCSQLTEANFIEWLIKSMLYNQIVRKSPTHPFVHIFGSALLANLLNFPAGRNYILHYGEPNVILRYLLDIVKEPMLPAEAICALLICVSTAMSACDSADYSNVEREIRELISNYQERTDENEEMKSLVFAACTALLQKQPIEPRLGREEEETSSSIEVFDFECFTDEILLET